MKRYKDYEGVREKLKGYSKKTGLKYRTMGCQESNNYFRLTWEIGLLQMIYFLMG